MRSLPHPACPECNLKWHRDLCQPVGTLDSGSRQALGRHVMEMERDGFVRVSHGVLDALAVCDASGQVSHGNGVAAALPVGTKDD